MMAATATAPTNIQKAAPARKGPIPVILIPRIVVGIYKMRPAGDLDATTPGTATATHRKMRIQCGQKAPAAPGNTTGLSKPSADTLATPKAKSSMAIFAKIRLSALPASRQCVKAGSVVSRQKPRSPAAGDPADAVHDRCTSGVTAPSTLTSVGG